MAHLIYGAGNTDVRSCCITQIKNLRAIGERKRAQELSIATRELFTSPRAKQFPQAQTVSAIVETLLGEVVQEYRTPR